MNTLKAGKTSSLNEANDIDKNGKKFSIQFYKMMIKRITNSQISQANSISQNELKLSI